MNDDLLIAQTLIAQMQAAAETDKIQLARLLHDELGEMMVAAAMDLSWASRLILRSFSESRPPLERAKTTLELAIVRSRQMIEELRPSILDNFGLFAALKWQLQRATYGSNTVYTESYPTPEPPLRSEISTGLFRIAQAALVMTFKRETVKTVDLDVCVENDTLSMRLTDDGTPILSDGQETATKLALASMQYRSRVLGGKVEIERNDQGCTILLVEMPLSLPPT